MDEIVRALFRGDVNALLPPYEENSRQTRAFSRVEDLTRQLKAEFPQQYHSALDAYEQAVMELMDAACEDDFVSGYRLGVRMMYAAWPRE